MKRNILTNLIENVKYNVLMIKRGIGIMIKMEKWYMPLSMAYSVIGTLARYVNIIMTAQILNELTGDRNIQTLYFYVALTVGLNMVMFLIPKGIGKISGYHREQFYRNEQMYFSEKVMSMDYEDIEDREILLMREKIKNDNQFGYNIYYLRTFFCGLLEDLTVSGAAAVLTWSLFTNRNIPLMSKLLILMFIGVIIFVNYYSSKRSGDHIMKMYDQIAETNPMYIYYYNYYTDYNAGKDVRIYGYEKFLIDRQKNLNGIVRNIQLKTNRKMIKYKILESLASDLLTIAVYIFVITACLGGNISIGSIFQYVSCVTMFVGSVGFIVQHSQYLITNNKRLETYFKFLDTPSRMYEGSLSVEKRDDNEYEIEFRNVSFKYPSADIYSLKNVSFRFSVGQKLAVVGMNGSGKTTMIKLLCRLYDPTEGQILLNGIDIKKYNYQEYLELFSVVFQDFKLFSFPIGQNVASTVDYDREKAEQCLKKAGLDNRDRFSNMPKGLDTPLYKDFEEDGVEISGGEAQKIALARALYKDAPFIVLDEPTAALDPVAEFEIYSKFNEIVGDKTAIYISHRLSSCRFCDDIAVFHEGELIQRGSHDSLISDADGKYYELWNAQAQYYTENNISAPV